jgi:Flp pilus assembly protein TadG
MRRAARLGAAPLAAATAALGVGLRLGGWDFVRQHWAPLLVAALLVGACLTLGVRLAAGAVRGAVLAARRPRELGQSGAAAAEFVIVVIPFLLMLTGLMQLSLASLGRVLVSYSAFCAARAAIVVVPEKIENAQNAGPLKDAVANEAENAVGYGQNTRTDFAVSKKASLIRNAAAYPLIAASPSIDVVIADTVNNFPAYLANRLKHGLDFGDYLKTIFGDLSGLPDKLKDGLVDELKQEASKGLDSAVERSQAKDDVNAWIDSQNASDAQKAIMKAFAQQAIDQAKGAANDAIGNQITQQINDLTSGPLEKFRDQLNQIAEGAAQGAGGSVGGGFHGYAVDRALDVGFGADTDGAGGALLRSLRKLVYAKMATVVTLLDDKGNFKSSFEWNEPIRARVTHLFYCQIPLANRFAGKAFYDLPDQTVLDVATGGLKGITTIGIPGYFLTLTAEHTLTNQGKK